MVMGGGEGRGGGEGEGGMCQRSRNDGHYS